ncbi:LAGLIDADG family homing endonuclease [Aggregatilineales bacterium SYSU G02658]
MVQSTVNKPNALHELGYKIFLDRYAQKDMTRATLTVGDTVIVVVDSKTGQREIGTVTAINLPKVTVQLNDGQVVERDLENVDKPLETQPEQMMDRVAAGIAQIEPTEALRQTWTQNFRWLLDDWKFVPGGRILTGAGTDQKLTYYNCMPPSQEVLTQHGYRPIAEVQVGDYVVTHRNRLRKVLHKFERETEEALYILNAQKIGYDALRLTGEHKVLVIRSEWVNTYKSRDGLRLDQAPAWIPASEIRVGDFVAVAHNAEVCPVAEIRLSDYIGVDSLMEAQGHDQPQSVYAVVENQLIKSRVQLDGSITLGKRPLPLNNTLPVDADLMFLFGRWLGNGCVTHRTGSDIPSGIKIVFNLDEHAEAEHIAAIIEAKFGIPAALKLSSTERWLDLWVNSMPVGEFFKAFFGAYSYAKTIPAKLMQLPDIETLALLRGIFSAEGYMSGNSIGLLLANRTLATQIHQLLLRLGYFFSIEENTHKNGRTPAYRLHATANECAPLFEALFDTPAPSYDVDLRYSIQHDDLRWVRVQSIEVETYRGIVMDMEVDEDHSFVSAGLVVSNCYVIPSPRDSRGGIMETLSHMTEIMSRGGGVGINISSLRPRHAYVKGVNGRSSGAVSWGALYSFVTGLIEQGGSRRGALMLILNDWHPDVFNFINSKREAGNITNANISVGISDRFMEAVKADGDWDLVFPDTSAPNYDDEWDGDLEAWQAKGGKVIHYKTIKARELWNAIIESAWASAEPGVWFRDRSNKMSNSWYFSPLISTNPCVTGETRAYTNRGMRRIADLFAEGAGFDVVIDERLGAGVQFAPSSRVFMTGVKPVYRLQTKQGYSVRATADHRIMTTRGWVELQHLQPGDEVHILNRKGGFGSAGSLDEGRILGWLVGDGTIKSDRVVLSFFGSEKQELAPLFSEAVNRLVAPMTTRRTYAVGIVEVGDRDEVRVQSERLRSHVKAYGLVDNKLQVPEVVFSGSEEMQRGFLQALFTADGSVQGTSEKGFSIRLASSTVELLSQVQMLLANFGIASQLYKNRRSDKLRLMPEGKGGKRLYHTRANHELLITRGNIATFAREVGFLTEAKQKRLHNALAAHPEGFYRQPFTATVTAIVPEGEEPVYDLIEEVTHSFVANGIVVHNCGEQPLSAWSVCNLGAINLARFYDPDKHDVAWDKLDRTVRYAVRFLDNVVDSTPYFFEENERKQRSERRVGLGTMGVAELMLYLGIRYGSDESVAFIEKLYKAIAIAAYETSADLAAEKGPFEAFDAEKVLQSGFMRQMPEEVRQRVKQKGLRNVTLLTQAPTGTTGTMVNTSTGIEPFFSWVYYRKSRLGLHEEQVPVVADWYAKNPGAEKLPEHFVTAMDLAPEEHVKVQGAFQRWIDSAISKTCNVPNHYTVEQVSQLYLQMYDLGCKGGTIYRDGSRDEQVLMLKGDERAEKEMEHLRKEEKPAPEPVQTPHKEYPRPVRLSGTTVKFRTPFGTSYITMNNDEHGNPFEVFITVGKAGSDIQADAEAMGRMISLQLRTTAPHNRREMLRLIMEQLHGIGGARPTGIGSNRVLSLPDAVANAIADYYFKEDTPQQLGLPMAGVEPVPPAPRRQTNGVQTVPNVTFMPAMEASGFNSGADMCPECGTISLIRAEGCRRCMTCGYTEC